MVEVIMAFLISVSTTPMKETCYTITWTKCSSKGCHVQYKKDKGYKRAYSKEKSIKVYDQHCEYTLNRN